MSMFDLRFVSFLGIFEIGYGAGVLATGDWVISAVIIGAVCLGVGLLLILIGEGLRLTWKR